MTPEEILPKLTDIIRDLLDDDTIELAATTTSGDVDGWDSVLHVSLIIAVEQRFKIRFQTAELEKLRDVGELLALIALKTR